MARRPAAPEYWWLYALLLATMIPSLINLVIGGASFVRGVPGLRSLLLTYIPMGGKAVPKFNRELLASVLALQGFAGAFLGIAAQAVLAIGVIGFIMPWLGLGLLDTARAVADFNLPARLGQFVAGTL